MIPSAARLAYSSLYRIGLSGMENITTAKGQIVNPLGLSNIPFFPIDTGRKIDADSLLLATCDDFLEVNSPMAQKKVVSCWEFPPLQIILDNIYDITQLVKDAGNLLCDTEIADTMRSRLRLRACNKGDTR